MRKFLNRSIATIFALSLILPKAIDINGSAYYASRTFNDGTASPVTAYLSVTTNNVYAALSSNEETYKTITVTCSNGYTASNSGVARRIYVCINGENIVCTNCEFCSNGHCMNGLNVWA